VKIGILEEGFGLETSEPDVDSAVRVAARALEKLGAVVSEVSVPLPSQARTLPSGALQAIVTPTFDHDGCLNERPDLVPLDYIAQQHEWRKRADERPANVKSVLITYEFIRQRSGYRHVALAKQAVRALRAAYDDAFEGVDALALPTTPMKATSLQADNASPSLVTKRVFAPFANTSAFNNTHHPAISVPCGPPDGLPIGMMVVGTSRNRRCTGLPTLTSKPADRCGRHLSRRRLLVHPAVWGGCLAARRDRPGARAGIARRYHRPLDVGNAIAAGGYKAEALSSAQAQPRRARR